MRWEQGPADVDRMIAAGELERVHPSREHADRLLGQARRTWDSDPEGAYGTLYDAGRKSLWAIIANQGLRPTHRGGHLAAYQAVVAQFDPPLGRELRPFDRMRRRRNEAAYPDVDSPELHTADVREDATKIRAIVEIADRVLDSMPVY
jgi:hypothetical protein